MDDGVVASTNPVWLHTTLESLTGLFDRVGLRKKVHKTMGMVLQPCWEVGIRADNAYKLRMAGEGRIY